MGKKVEKLLEIVDFFRDEKKKGARNHISNWCREVQGFQPN